MDELVTAIRTENGPTKIDYNALANLPKSDTALVKSGGFADAKAVGDALKKKADSTNVPTHLSELTNDVGFLTEIPEEYVTTDMLSKQGYLTEAQLNEKGYVTEELLAEQGFVTESVLHEKGYVTETVLSEQGYVTQEQLTNELIATDETPGVVMPGDGLSILDGALHVDKHPLEDLSNIHVCDTMPDASAIIEGHWYLVKAE